MLDLMLPHVESERVIVPLKHDIDIDITCVIVDEPDSPLIQLRILLCDMVGGIIQQVDPERAIEIVPARCVEDEEAEG